MNNTTNNNKLKKVKKLFNNTGKLLERVAPGFLVDIPLLCVYGVPGAIIKGINKLKDPIINSKYPLVILIHGTGVKSWQWGVAENFLRNHNIEYDSVNYTYTNSIKDSICEVHTQIEKICKKRNCIDVILIGHSQGGLISRWIYNTYDKTNNKYNVIKNFSLNAPQTGTSACKLRNKLLHYCNIIPDNSFRDMEPDSEFINEYQSVCVDTDSFLVAGRLDFVEQSSALWGSRNKSKKYITFGGHYYSAVDPKMWHNFIIPNITNEYNNYSELLKYLDDT